MKAFYIKKSSNIWLEEEMLLTLYIYLTHNSEDLNKTSKFLQDFSKRLNFFTGIDRTVDSIAIRISNFKAVDPNYSGTGLPNGGKKVLECWNKYSNNLDYLKELYDKFVKNTFSMIDNQAKEELTFIDKQLKNMGNPDNFKDIDIQEKDAYVESLITVRNGAIQRIFRDNLIMEFNQKCALCGINNRNLLIASHILPYSKCKNKEDMINHNNGLLLCPIHDALFDKKYITFDENGKIVINKEIDKKLYSNFNINDNMYLSKKYLNNERLDFLKKHMKLFEKTARN